jgi:hypothetical protein
VTFSRLDFAQLRAWISPAETGDSSFTGFAEGEMRIEDPRSSPKRSVPRFASPVEIGPAPTAAAPASLTLRNAGPVVANLGNSILTVQSARLTEPLHRRDDRRPRPPPERPQPLDLRVAGKVDLGIVQDFDPDLVASGTLTGDATIRGKPDALLITGRVQVRTPPSISSTSPTASPTPTARSCSPATARPSKS